MIRKAEARDAETLIRLIDALAEYEQLEGPSEAAKARLIEDGFGERPRYEAYLAESDGEAVGYAITFETYSTFLAKPTLYLEDLFVLPHARRAGAGRTFFQHLARVALERGCGRIEWTVLDWNASAIRFYDSLGGQHLREWLHYRLDEGSIEDLAR
ncbi:MAG: GNAT family N-acetyltransferase [Armatimonadetes bacterium]|nr:GNAT family N-acetyltransferase [Armatimonadota bacterium]